MVDANIILKSLKSGIYEWDAETETFSWISMRAEINARGSIFCLNNKSNKESGNG